MLRTAWRDARLNVQWVVDPAHCPLDGRFDLLAIFTDALADMERGKGLRDSEQERRLGKQAARADTASKTEDYSTRIGLGIGTKEALGLECHWVVIVLRVMEKEPEGDGEVRSHKKVEDPT